MASMPPPNKKPPERPEPTEETDPGAPIDMLKTGTMRRLPRKPSAFARPAAQEGEPAPADGAGERTLVYDQNQGRPLGQGAPRVIFTAGPRAKTEVELTQAETSLGRGGENTVVIPDLSVSRHHAVIRREKGGFVVLDQGSGNGTRVNGMIVGRHELQSGDVIDLGDTSLQFVEAGGVMVKSGKRSAPGQSPPLAGIRAGGSPAKAEEK